MSNKANKVKRLEPKLWRIAFVLLNTIAATILLLMIALTVTDVVARYVFNSPIDGAYELTEIMLALTIFSALPITTYSKQHIIVELIAPFKNPSLLKLQTVFIGLMSVSILTFVAYAVAIHALKLEKHGQVSNSLDIPIYLIASYAALSLFLCAWIVLSALIKECQPIEARNQNQEGDMNKGSNP